MNHQRELRRYFEDNQSCIKILENEGSSDFGKHIDVKYLYTMELVKKGTIRIQYCPSEHNVADMLTKPLGPMRLRTLSNEIGLKIWN